MKHTLSDGTVVDLAQVRSVSSLRDLGEDPGSIMLSRIGFTIRCIKGEDIKIIRYYHYTDWAKVKKELEQDRQGLIKAWNDFKDR